MEEFDKLIATIEESKEKIRNFPQFSTPDISSEDLKDQLLPILEEAKDTLNKSKERYQKLERLNQDIDTIRDEIISPVNNKIETTNKKTNRSNFWFGVLGLLIGLVSMIFSFVKSISKPETEIILNKYQDEVISNIISNSDGTRYLINTLNEPNNEIKFDNLLFHSNSDYLVPSSEIELNRLLNILYYKKDFRVCLSGHTDDTGSNYSNHRMAERRLNKIQRFLTSRGVEEERVYIENNFGEDEPEMNNSTLLGKQINRRVEVTVINNY